MGPTRRRLLIREEASEGGVACKVSRQRDETIFWPNSSEITSNASTGKDICNWLNGKETVLLYW